MSIKFTIKNVPIVCDNPEEAAELIKALTNGVAITSPQQTEQPSRSVDELQFAQKGLEIKAATEIIPENVSRTVRFMYGLKSFRRIDSDQVTQLLSLEGPRGVGGALVGISSDIRNHGFQPEDVFQKRGQPGAFYWVPGPRFVEAFSALTRNGE